MLFKVWYQHSWRCPGTVFNIPSTDTGEKNNQLNYLRFISTALSPLYVKLNLKWISIKIWDFLLFLPFLFLPFWCLKWEKKVFLDNMWYLQSTSRSEISCYLYRMKLHIWYIVNIYIYKKDIPSFFEGTQIRLDKIHLFLHFLFLLRKKKISKIHLIYINWI